MKTRTMFLNQDDLAIYLRKNWKGPETKQYELLLAFYLAKITTYKHKKKYALGFPLKPSAYKNIPFEYSEESVEEVFNTYIQEDTQVDVFLVPEDSIKIKTDGVTGQAKGASFQFKKIVSSGESPTTEISQFLNITIPESYVKTDTILLLFINPPSFKGTIYLDQLNKSLTFVDYPFNQILFFGGSGEETFFGEIWPTLGYDVYTKDEFLKIVTFVPEDKLVT